MTYDEFLAYVTETLWRTGDAEFAVALPQMILEAEARMSRDLRIEDNTTIAELSMEANSIALPADYAEIRSVSFAPYESTAYVTPQRFGYLSTQNFSTPPPFYTVMTKKIYVPGDISAALPLPVSILYYTKVPAFVDNPTDNPFYETYPDLYLAAVLTNTYIFLRQDQRAELQESKYKALAESTMHNEASRKNAGAPLFWGLPGVVA